jgi:hypothetical protein
MDKPRFIRALLEEVGTAINPIALVRRIPEGLEVEGLREGLKHIMKEHEIQFSICEGVARVLRSEVAAAQGLLRMGQRRGVRFEVAAGGSRLPAREKDAAVAAAAAPPPPPPALSGAPAAAAAAAAAAAEKAPAHAHAHAHANGDGAAAAAAAARPASDSRKAKKWTPGHCAQCLEPFVEWEVETLVGFACGHVFHLTHLLEKLHPHGKGVEVEDYGALNGGVAEQQRASATHLIGAKVTHARLLRDRIAGGCPVCVVSEAGEGGR